MGTPVFRNWLEWGLKAGWWGGEPRLGPLLAASPFSPTVSRVLLSAYCCLLHPSRGFLFRLLAYPASGFSDFSPASPRWCQALPDPVLSLQLMGPQASLWRGPAAGIWGGLSWAKSPQGELQPCGSGGLGGQAQNLPLASLMPLTGWCPRRPPPTAV